MTVIAALVMLLAPVLPSASMQFQDGRIAVYVTAPTRDGFVDTGKDIQDSVKDIRNKIKDTKELRLAEQASDADVILTVVTRGVGSQAYGVRTNVYSNYYSGTDVSTVPIVANTFWISTVLQAGKYRKEFTGTQTQSSAMSMGAWTEIAGRISKEVKAWALANADQLRVKRASKSGKR
jgi:hypothetical protein